MKQLPFCLLDRKTVPKRRKLIKLPSQNLMDYAANRFVLEKGFFFFFFTSQHQTVKLELFIFSFLFLFWIIFFWWTIFLSHFPGNQTEKGKKQIKKEKRKETHEAKPQLRWNYQIEYHSRASETSRDYDTTNQEEKAGPQEQKRDQRTWAAQRRKAEVKPTSTGAFAGK